MKKVTAEQVFEAYQQTMANAPERQILFRQLPEHFEDMNESDKKLFQDMAWKMNVIIGEFAE